MIARHREAVEQNGGRMTLESCPLLPQTGAALQDMLQVVCYRRTYVPYQVTGGSLCLECFIPWGFLRVSVPGHWGLPLSGILHSSLGDFMRGAVPGHWRLSLSGILHTMGDS